jgi:hypothetical protein
MYTLLMVTKPKPQKVNKHHAGHALWNMAQKYVRDIPKAELEKLPRDGASNHDYYLYGSPKRK